MKARSNALFRARVRALAGLALVIGLAGCSSTPPVPDWQMNAKGALERATAAWLEGNTRVAEAEFGRARAEASRTGQVDVVARVELTRCAARVASLDLGACEAFERLRVDAAPPERAYADYLAARLAPSEAARLPEQHRAVAGNPRALAQVTDPLAQLVAAGVVFAAGQASPATVQTAVDTASAQGWRRPLLAWLGLQAQLADKAGDAESVERVRRRIVLVEGGR